MMPAASTSPSLAIAVERISKAYRIWSSPSSRIVARLFEGIADRFPEQSGTSHRLSQRAQRLYRDFYALRDVSFELRRGEALGIVGRNGSGKSTLLQIVAGTLRASSGEVSAHGRVAALLELGSGFNPEFTGRENVHLNATVLGLSRAKIAARFDDIAAFADIGDFMDQPVKFLSSGMIMRLAFAVAIHVDPEILIVDEALSVGDARFQLKCARAIDAQLDRGVSLLFVSHDLSTVKRICHSALLLEGGRVLYHGHPNDVVNLYSRLVAEGGTAEALAEDVARLQAQSIQETAASESHLRKEMIHADPEPAAATDVDDEASQHKVEAFHAAERNGTPLGGGEYSYGGELGRIDEVTILDATGQQRTWFDTGETAIVRLRVTAHHTIAEPIFALTIKNSAGVDVYGTNTLFSRQTTEPMKPDSCAEVDFILPLNLMRGAYFLSVGFTHFVGEQLAVIHRRYDVAKLDVHAVDWTFGIANLWAKIEVRPLAPCKPPEP